VKPLSHVYGFFYECGGYPRLLSLHRNELLARDAALSSTYLVLLTVVPGSGGWEETKPSYPHGQNPDVFAWRRVDDEGKRHYLFVRKLAVE
jgi:hypothetical protein